MKCDSLLLGKGGEVGSYPYNADVCVDALNPIGNLMVQARNSRCGWEDTCTGGSCRWWHATGHGQCWPSPETLQTVCKEHGLLFVIIWERKNEFSGNFGMVGAVTASPLFPGGEREGERQQEERGCAQPAQVEIRKRAKPLSNPVHQT